MKTSEMETKKLIDEKWGTEKLPRGGVVIESATSLLFKTGDWRIYKPVLKEEVCIGCTKCYFVCPDDCIELNENYAPIFDLDFCKGCSLCMDICPPHAIDMILEVK
ncbi:MAG: Pyruvate synthase subunit PorD [Candidatus Heimdallarchaeota archaeon LC_2]|nr:MAG: Pyruvate synthase subunit PorD [Candidatus Heimdallarchaeota archaeon LC_2]